MRHAVQELVEALADSLSRSVTIDDVESNLLASSRHFDDADQLRVNSLIERASPEAVVQFLRNQGMLRWQQPHRVTGSEELGFSSRHCFPLRSKHGMLGTLFVIDEPPLSHDEIERVRAGAEEATRILGHQRDQDTAVLTEREQMLRDLFRSSTERQEPAASYFREHFTDAGALQSFTVVLSSPLAGTDAALPVSEMRRAAQRLSSSHDIVCATVEEGIAFLVRASNSGRIDHLCQGLSERLAQIDDSIRSTRGSIVDDLHAVQDSYEQAVIMRRVLQEHSSGATLTRFGDNGVLDLFAGLVRGKIERHMLTPLVSALEQVHNETLLHTLEQFLDHAGDVTATARALYLHRSTVYYRIGRLEQLLGISLGDGSVRLHLHAWIKLRQLVLPK